QLDQSDAVLAELLTSQPTNFHVFRHLGENARARGDRLQSLAHFRKAVELDRQNQWSYLSASDDLRALGRYDEARTMLEALLAIDPPNANAWRGLGSVA